MNTPELLILLLILGVLLYATEHGGPKGPRGV